MPGKVSSKTPAKLLFFTSKQRAQLSKLLHDARPDGSHDKAIARMDRLAAKFGVALKSIGFRPFVEDFDRVMGSTSYEQSYNLRIEASAAALEKEWIGVGKANRLLDRFATDIGRCWKEATGRPLPKVKAGLLERCGAGYRGELAGLATTHPLWLIFEALELKAGARSVNQLVCWARREAGEAIDVPELVEPVLHPIRLPRLH